MVRFPYFVTDQSGEIRGAFPLLMDAEAMADAVGGKVLRWAEAVGVCASDTENYPQFTARMRVFRAMSEGTVV